MLGIGFQPAVSATYPQACINAEISAGTGSRHVTGPGVNGWLV